jgi:hypothetical protein
VNRITENILGTGVVQLASDGTKSPTQAEVGGLMVDPDARASRPPSHGTLYSRMIPVTRVVSLRGWFMLRDAGGEESGC